MGDSFRQQRYKCLITADTVHHMIHVSTSHKNILFPGRSHKDFVLSIHKYKIRSLRTAQRKSSDNLYYASHNGSVVEIMQRCKFVIYFKSCGKRKIRCRKYFVRVCSSAHSFLLGVYKPILIYQRIYNTSFQ